MKNLRPFFALLGLALVSATQARAQVINFQFTQGNNTPTLNGDSWSATVSPLAYTGTTWNHGAGFGTPTGTSLLDSNGNPTSVGFTLSGDVNYANGDTFQPLPMFYETQYTGNGMTLTINGLQNGQAYNLYLDSAFNGGDGGFFTLGSTIKQVAGTTQSSYISGQNYLEFGSVIATSNSIVVTIATDGTGQALAMLNGFQITEAPEPTSVALVSLGAAALFFVGYRKRQMSL